MRIRERKPPVDCSVSSSPSPSPSPSSSSFSSYTSSITAAHSLASSQDSSNSCSFPAASPRCHGLDLLVKAIYQVDAGSVVGVPYIQRRVTIRRRRRIHGLEFDAFVLDGLRQRNVTKKLSKSKKSKKGKDLVGLSSTIRGSVSKPWTRRSDRADEMGF